MASFRKRGSTWQYRIKHKDPLTHEQIEVSKGGFKTKKEAQLAARQEELRLNSDLEINGGDVLLKHYLKDWLTEYKQGTVRKNTYILHERNVKTKILPYFKDIKLKDIKPLRYQKFINHLAEQGYSKRTIEIIHGTMFNALSTAVKPLKKLEENPCEGVTIPKIPKKKEKLAYINSDDISFFLKIARQDNYLYYIFFKTLLETGMRKGEAAALQRKDIDLKNNYIHINKSLDFQVKEGEERFGETKTYESERRIKISNSLAKELTAHMKYLNDNRIVFNEVYEHELDLVFCREDGKPLPKSTLFNALNRILKKSGLNKMPIHGLRHTHAVLLLESGATMKFVQERLGHKNITITSDVYSHISEKLENSSVDGYEEYMNSLLS
ncbi:MULTISPECIES: site-specific integrase [Bacillus]|uniref:Phage integrase n=4 Tax=Bacillus amyloliquefaciens group TaxID=1938374 RepID=A0A9P1JHK5_BACAS|nr:MULTISPECIES: site-specific integrase [Bacillus]AFJ61904.1 DNA integration/recombination/inversion protein [Bacillus velezensis YAU B9601-Y2]APA02796.1 site-specific integrase [Bacillus velezensis]AUG35869.1 site-specific integrase [Bacillus velezensis]AVB11395.1 site-specific integrase [Bacillus velezensis]AYK67715.1 site-specific integrase [Bacillus subtilis subsp. subtilis]